MSKLLAQLLDEPEHDLASLVLGLEKLSGHPGGDVKLGLEIEKIASDKIRLLGLDSADTTGEELYHALVSRFEQDENHFVRSLGGSSRHSHEQLLPLVMSKLSKHGGLGTSYALKRATAKELLKNCPPKALMKHLRYRTLDSLLKRESTEEILAAAPYTEGRQWGERFMKQFAKLAPADFESRNIEITAMPAERWADLPRRGSIVGYVDYLGSVAVWPASLTQSSGLALAVLVLQAADSVRTAGSWLKFNQLSPGFSRLVLESAAGRSSAPIMINAQPVEWRSVAHYYGRQHSKLPSRLAEGLEPGDLPVSVEAQLCKLDSALSWWLGLDFVGVLKELKVSFNLADVAVNAANQITYADSTAAWMEQALFDELIARYLSNQWAEDALLTRLEEGAS